MSERISKVIESPGKEVVVPEASGVSEASDVKADSKLEAEVPAIRIRYRVRFGKTGLLRWISHRDLASLWERLVRRASLKLSMSEGFHPKPRIAFPSALALGVESLDEVVELELAEELTPAELMQRLVDDNQPGLTICSVRKLPEGFGKAQLDCSDYVVTAPIFDRSYARQSVGHGGSPPSGEGSHQALGDSYQVEWDTVQKAIDELLAKPEVSIQRKKKTQSFDIAANMKSIEITKDSIGNRTVNLTIKNPQGAVLKPTDVLDLLGLDEWIEAGATITRTNVHLQKEYDNKEPEHYACSGDVPTASTAK